MLEVHIVELTGKELAKKFKLCQLLVLARVCCGMRAAQDPEFGAVARVIFSKLSNDICDNAIDEADQKEVVGHFICQVAGKELLTILGASIVSPLAYIAAVQRTCSTCKELQDRYVEQQRSFFNNLFQNPN